VSNERCGVLSAREVFSKSRQQLSVLWQGRAVLGAQVMTRLFRSSHPLASSSRSARWTVRSLARIPQAMVAMTGQQVARSLMYERSTSAAATARLGSSVSTSRMASSHRIGD